MNNQCRVLEVFRITIGVVIIIACDQNYKRKTGAILTDKNSNQWKVTGYSNTATLNLKRGEYDLSDMENIYDLMVEYNDQQPQIEPGDFLILS